MATNEQRHAAVKAPKTKVTVVKHSSPIDEDPVVIMKDFQERRPDTPAPKRRRSVRFAEGSKPGDSDDDELVDVAANMLEDTQPLKDPEEPDGEQSDADDTLQLNLSDEAMEELGEDPPAAANAPESAAAAAPVMDERGGAAAAAPDTTTPTKEVAIVRPVSAAAAAAAHGFKLPQAPRRRGLFPPKAASPPRKDKRKLLKPKRG